MTEEGFGTQTKGLASRLLEPKAILFGFAILYFSWMVVSVVRFERDNQFITEAGWGPRAAMIWPLLLLLSSIGLLIGRSWSYVLAILITGWLVYTIGYQGLAGVFYAHGKPMLSLDAFRIWFQVMGGSRIITTVFALVILIFGIVQLSRTVARHIHHATTTDEESTTIS